MRSIFGMALLAAVAAAPVAVEAQTPRAGQTQEQAMRPWAGAPSPRMLQQLRTELQLTDAQVSRLEAIYQRVRAQNEPLVAQLRASGAWQGKDGRTGARGGAHGARTPEQREQLRERARNMTPEQREAFRQEMKQRRQQGENVARGARQLPEELRPVAQQVRENTRAGMEEARAVLTAEQQTRLREIMQERRTSARNRAGQARGLRSGR